MNREQVLKSEKGLLDEFRKEMNSFIDRGFDMLESEQSKVNKAMFDALEPEQRDRFCKSLSNQGVKSSRIEKITAKSQSTINRHLNGKNS